MNLALQAFITTVDLYQEAWIEDRKARLHAFHLADLEVHQLEVAKNNGHRVPIKKMAEAISRRRKANLDLKTQGVFS